MSATIFEGITHLRFCTHCHQIFIVGKWQKINKKIEMELRKNYGLWEATMVLCEGCEVKND